MSLTAPKPLVRWFRGRHFVGGRLVFSFHFIYFGERGGEGRGNQRVEWFVMMLIHDVRFVSPDIKQKYGLWLPEYEGLDQVVEVGKDGEKL